MKEAMLSHSYAGEGGGLLLTTGQIKVHFYAIFASRITIGVALCDCHTLDIH